MKFLANLLSNAAEDGGATPYTWWLIWDEPECPEELL